MDKECEICFNKFSNFLCFKYLKCGHSTCNQCYISIIKTTKKCPFCRKKISEEEPFSQSLPQPVIQRIEERVPLEERYSIDITNTKQYRRMKKREKEINKSEIWGKKANRKQNRRTKKARYNQIDDMMFELEI